MKTCSKCQEIKPISAFGKHARHKDGHNRTCKKCKAIMDAEYAKCYAPAAMSGIEPEMTLRDVADVLWAYRIKLSVRSRIERYANYTPRLKNAESILWVC
jgi:hypothetical protein